MKSKIVIVIIALVMSCGALTSCQSNDEVPKLKYSTQYPATATEYNLLINQKIVPFLNVCEGHCAKGRDIALGKYPVDEEITSVEDTLSYINDIYSSVKVIYPPQEETQRHSDTLMQMKRIINAVEVYKEQLDKFKEDGNKDTLGKTVDIMSSEFTNLKNMFNTLA